MRRVGLVGLGAILLLGAALALRAPRRPEKGPVHAARRLSPEPVAASAADAEAAPPRPAPAEAEQSPKAAVTDAHRAAEWRVRQSGFGPDPSPTPDWVANMTQYYSSYLQLNEIQTAGLQSLLSEWSTRHYELLSRVATYVGGRSDWEAVRRAAEVEHRRRWDGFLTQMRGYLTESQVEALERNYPGQFAEYGPAGDDEG